MINKKLFDNLIEVIEKTDCSNPNRQMLFGLFLTEVVILGHIVASNYLMTAIISALQNPHMSLEKYNQIQADLYLG
jgi:hypothetical protein